MKKLVLILFAIVTVSCTNEDVEPIVLTNEVLLVELSNSGLFATDNITAEANQNLTFLRIRATLREQLFVLEIGS